MKRSFLTSGPEKSSFNAYETDINTIYARNRVYVLYFIGKCAVINKQLLQKLNSLFS